MRRILVFGMTENPGGVESFLLNYYRNIDREKIQFDFLSNTYEPVAFEDELTALGARVYHISARSKEYRRYKLELENVFQKHHSDWSTIWVNISSLANIDYLKIAKRYGIKQRIIHSHASGNMDSRLRGILHSWNRRIINKYATDFWACSKEAAEWFYNKGLMPKVRIIHNALDTNRLIFDPEKRKIIRNSIGAAESTFVIGNVGRLHFEKNQRFSLEVFRELLKIRPNSKLVFVGQGEDEASLREISTDLRENVIFAGVQTDMQAWMSAFDFFLFPSLFEGLGIAALEAQANGLPVLASAHCVPEEVKVIDSFSFYELNHSPGEWAQKIVSSNYERSAFEDIKNRFINKGYEVATEAHKLEELFI